MLSIPLIAFFDLQQHILQRAYRTWKTKTSTRIGSRKPVGNRNTVSGGVGGGVVTVTNNIAQGSFQGGTNINEDNDGVIGQQCNDGHIQVNDEGEVRQTNIQSSNHEANSDNEEEAYSYNKFKDTTCKTGVVLLDKKL
ncbi:MAG TPA: hypothetical protein VHF65_08985 [Nitrososphaera sp.]|nr:hypothetical protein [Nitrososphaera sp.]